MGDSEQELREAMVAAVAGEQPPDNLIEVIRRRHRRHVVRLTAFGAAAIVAVLYIASAAATASHDRTGPGVRPSSPPSAVPGTELLTCRDAVNGDLGPAAEWHKRSVRAGPLWFVGARDRASDGRSGRLPDFYRQGWEMAFVVDPGTTVSVTVPAQERPYIWFASGPGPGGLQGVTFVSCPAVPVPPGTTVVNPGGTSQFGVGIKVTAPRCITFDVWTSASTRPIEVTLSFGAGACPAGR
jgi:hypothetical protein